MLTIIYIRIAESFLIATVGRQIPLSNKGYYQVRVVKVFAVNILKIRSQCRITAIEIGNENCIWGIRSRTKGSCQTMIADRQIIN